MLPFATKSPGLILVLPVYVIDHAMITSQKLHRNFHIPKKDRVYTEDVCDGWSLCMADYLIQAQDGQTSYPNAFVDTLKKGVPTTSTGGVFEYTGRCKTTVLKYSTGAQDILLNKPPPQLPTQIVHVVDILQEHCPTDHNEDGVDIDLMLSEWNESHRSDEETAMGDNA